MVLLTECGSDVFWREMSVIMRWRTKLASVFRRKNSNSNFFHHHSAVYRILNRIYSKVRNMKISWIFDIFRHSCECENENTIIIIFFVAKIQIRTFFYHFSWVHNSFIALCLEIFPTSFSILFGPLLNVSSLQ